MLVQSERVRGLVRPQGSDLMILGPLLSFTLVLAEPSAIFAFTVQRGLPLEPFCFFAAGASSSRSSDLTLVPSPATLPSMPPWVRKPFDMASSVAFTRAAPFRRLGLRSVSSSAAFAVSRIEACTDADPPSPMSSSTRSPMFSTATLYVASKWRALVLVAASCFDTPPSAAMRSK